MKYARTVFELEWVPRFQPVINEVLRRVLVVMCGEEVMYGYDDFKMYRYWRKR